MIAIFFGPPGVGKSTLYACIAQLNKRKKEAYYERISKSKLYALLEPLQIPLDHIELRTLNTKDKVIYLFNKTKNSIPIALFNMLYSKNFFDVIYCTDETIQDTIYVDYADWGMFKPTPNCLFLGEEAGIGISNRAWKGLSKESKRFACIHRHQLACIALVSQTVDVDKVYKARAEIMHQIHKFGPFTVLRRIVYNTGVDDETHQLADKYYNITPFQWFMELLRSVKKKNRYKKIRWEKSFFIYRPFWYPYFDSYVDNYDYPMPDPYLVYLEQQEKQQQEQEEQENEDNDN